MTKRKTNEEYLKEVNELTKGEYVPVTPYVNSATKLKMKHKACGTIWEVKPNNFKTGTRCPKCAELAKTKTTEKFREEVKKLTKGTLELKGEYFGCDTHTEVFCTKHKLTISVRPTSIIRGKKVCPKCNAEYLSMCQRKDQKLFEKQLAHKHNGRIISLEPYVNTHTKIKFKCTACCSEFKSEPNSVLRISGCPWCKQSKGELLIAGVLTKLGIDFETQKTFPDCTFKRELPYDFYIEEYRVLIEFDGEQHYKPIEFFGGKTAFEYQKIRDNIKNDFAKKNGFTLLRIRGNMSEDCVRKKIENILQEVTQKPYQIGYDIV